MGYMQTLITHIHCVCFLVEVSDYQSHASILRFMISFLGFFTQPLQAFNSFLAILHETLKRVHTLFPVDPEF